MALKSRVVVRDVDRDEARELAIESISWLTQATYSGHTHKAMAMVIKTSWRQERCYGVAFNGKLSGKLDKADGGRGHMHTASSFGFAKRCVLQAGSARSPSVHL